MDAEMREAIAKLDLKMDRLIERFGDHVEACAREKQELYDSVRNAHRRIDFQDDKNKERRGWFAALWIGVVIAFASSVIAWLTGRKS